MEISKFYFLNHENPPKQSKLMQTAFFILVKKNSHPKWFKFNDLKTVTLWKHDLIVMENFDGEAFEYFKSSNVRIISPCLILFLDQEYCSKPFSTIPYRDWPVFSQCMRELEIVCSNVSSEKKQQLQEKILMMSGAYNPKLTAHASFLVSDSVLSTKYHAAGRHKIPIMTVEWVEQCWNKYQFDVLRANDDVVIAKHRLPLFYDLNVTVSGLSNDQRNEIKTIVEQNGAKYHSALNLKPILPNTIVILQTAQGDKYEYAKKARIPCVRLQWIHDSVQAKYALPLNDYQVDRVEEELLASSLENISSNNEEDDHIPFQNESFSQSTQLDVIQKDESSESDNSESTYLFEPKIMFSAFDEETKQQLTDKVQKVLSLTVVDSPLVSEDLTHLILNEPCATEKVFAAIVANVWILKPDFILDSLKAKEIQTESDYHWGLDFIDDNEDDVDVENRKSVNQRLMISALKWKHYLDDENQRLFQNKKFLLFNRSDDSLALKSCTNILRSGGAELYSIYDFGKSIADLDSLIRECSHVLVDQNTFEAQKPPIESEKMFQYLEYSERKNLIVTPQAIFNYILEGPEFSLRKTPLKLTVDVNKLKKSLVKLYHTK